MTAPKAQVKRTWGIFMNKEINCCPELVDGKKCDYLGFVYRIINQTRVKEDNIERSVAVEVALHLRVEGCTNALERGNLIYSTTLLPGEKVRIYTQDQKSRFSFEARNENHFESSNRIYQNKNQSHSVSYLFYQVNKRQTTQFTIMAVKARVIDPIAKSDVVNHPLVADRKLTIIPTAVQSMVLRTSVTWQTWYSPQLTYWVLMKILAIH